MSSNAALTFDSVIDTYHRFAENVQCIRHDLHRTLQELRAGERWIAADGAPAKGTALLSVLEIRSLTIEYIADWCALKQGLYTPRSRTPVVSPDCLVADKSDYVALFARNFADEILEQRSDRWGGDKFIVPAHEVRIV
jgi:C-methyltransferase C-terminal domain